MKNLKLRLFLFFLAQILIAIWGTNIFQKEANPFALLIITGLFAWYSVQYLSFEDQPVKSSPSPAYFPWIHALVGMFGIFTAYEELRKIWVKYPYPGKISDVLPQLEGQCALFFTGQFPYQPIPQPDHNPFPVYMPLHWSPIQIAYFLHIDPRWSGIILLALAIGIAGYWLSKSHPSAPPQYSLPAMLLFALPLWAYVVWSGIDIAVSLEGIVAAWYILLAAGLAARNYPLIVIGMIGALLSRYTMVFWTIPFAVLLWLHAPRKYSYWVWGTVGSGVMLLFVIPFWMKDSTIVSKILAYYNGCSEGSWLRPDEYTFKEGLSLNIHLRRWLPGTPEENLAIRNLPQILVQLLLGGFGVYYYEKKWKDRVDFMSYSLALLVLMVLALYSFSPMLFRYYMLMPLSVSAVLCWKILAAQKTNQA